MNDASWKTLYPFASHWYTLEAGRMHFLDEGPQAADARDTSPQAADAPDTSPQSASPPRTLLMVHGNPTWSFYWRGLVTAFRDRYRVVVPDHLGSGLSDKPQDYPYQLQCHVGNLVRLVDALDLREVTLLGHDWGGAIGLGAAMLRPERFSRFVMFNTGAFPPPFFPWRIRACRTPVLGPLAMRGLNLFSRAALRMAVADPARLSPQARAGLLAPYDSWAHRVGVWNFVRDIPTSPDQPTWQLLERIEASLAAASAKPWMFVWGMQDWCFRPECLERFLRHVPHAEVHRLPEAGHWVVEEANTRIIEWLGAFLERPVAPLTA